MTFFLPFGLRPFLFWCKYIHTRKKNILSRWPHKASVIWGSCPLGPSSHFLDYFVLTQTPLSYSLTTELQLSIHDYCTWWRESRDEVHPHTTTSRPLSGTSVVPHLTQETPRIPYPVSGSVITWYHWDKGLSRPTSRTRQLLTSSSTDSRFYYYNDKLHTRKSDDPPHPDGVLKNEVRLKILHYRSLYVDRPRSHCLHYLTVSTSSHLYHDFIRLLLIPVHRETGSLDRHSE